jgi:Fe-S-cluster-containing dehydrogenase component
VVDSSKCTGCRSCTAACPFHVPQYGRTGTMQKCNFCTERLQQGKQPSCVATCPGEALKCGPLEVLIESSNTRKPAERLSGPTIPSLIISGRLKEGVLSARMHDWI